MDSFHWWVLPLWHLHAAFVAAAVLGIILFIVWAVKLSPEHLMKWVKWLLLVGVIGAVITAPVSMFGWGRDGGGQMMKCHGEKCGMMKDGMMKDGMMKKDMTTGNDSATGTAAQ